eukprot:104648-Amorphochlora_amoeboformis.AAC.2
MAPVPYTPQARNGRLLRRTSIIFALVLCVMLLNSFGGRWQEVGASISVGRKSVMAGKTRLSRVSCRGSFGKFPNIEV